MQVRSGYPCAMLTFLLACQVDLPRRPPGPPLEEAVLDSFSMERVRDDLELVASDEQGGRAPGSPGHAFVRAWLASEMEAAGLQPGGSFEVEVPLSLDHPRYALDDSGQIYEIPLQQTGTNLLGFWPGSDPALADEVVLLVAHYDHLGVTERGSPYNGAFDDAAAVCALLELARALAAHEVQLPRTVGFLFTDAEEDGLDGAAAWLAEPTVPLTDVVAALSVDPIGRPILSDFSPLVAIGAERSPEIGAAIEHITPWLVPGSEIRRVSRTPVVVFASDQDVFWDAPSPIPALWLSSGGMSFYHTPEDDPITIDYRSIRSHLRAVSLLAAELARAEVRPVDLGPRPLSLEDLREAISMLEGAEASAELTEEERAVAADYRETFERALKAGTADTPEIITAYASMLLYVIQQLTPAHPGPIPPPF
jgi:hypothetical protein